MIRNKRLVLIACIPLLFAVCPIAPPSIDYFAVDPTAINPGESAQLSWNVTNASRIVIPEIGLDYSFAQSAWTGGNKFNYSEVVSPQVTTTYHLTAYNGRRESAEEVTLTVNTLSIAHRIIDFKVTPKIIRYGAEAELSWIVSGAESVEIDQGIGEVTSLDNPDGGQRTITPEQSTTYTLTVTSGQETVSQTCSITVRNVANVIMTNGPTWREDDLSFSYFGTVKNVGNIQAKLVKVFIYLYDSAGKLLASDETIVDRIDLDQDQTSAWDVKFADIDKLIRNRVDKSRTRYEIRWGQ